MSCLSKKLIRGFRTNIMLYGMCLAAFVIAAFPFSPLLAVAEALVSALVLYVGVRRNRMAQHSVRQYLDRVSGGMDTARSSNMLYAPLPMLVFDLNTGEILWGNDRFVGLTGLKDKLFEVTVADAVPGFDSHWLLEGKREAPEYVVWNHRTYRVFGALSHPDELKGDHNMLATTYWLDITEAEQMRQTLDMTRPTVAILMIDNYEDLMKACPESKRSALLADIEGKLNDWCADSGGLLLGYDRDRYLFVMEEKDFSTYAEKKFDVLDSVRTVESGGVSATLSIGVGRDGDELLNLPPDELERLLFDDVPFLEVAQQEHDTFAQILRDQGVEVLYLENLVAEVFDQVPGARAEFTDQYIAEAGIRGQHMPQIVREKLDSIEDNLEFVKKTMAGMTKSEIDMPLTASTTLDSLVNSESESDLIIDPMPNLYFTRDPFAVVGEGVNLNRMYSVTRNRETLYGKYVFKYHPDYKDVSLYFRRDCQFHTEGGDVLNINERTLAVGISQRTQAAAIDVMAQNIFWNSDSKVERILAFDIPVSRAFMHLDTVFTQIDVDKFTIHPAIMGTLRVYELTAGKNPGDVNIRLIEDTLEHVLEDATGVDQVKLIPCGGGDPIAASREQWNDGSNTLCVEPGKICVYARNTVTNDVLYKEGLDLLVVPSAELSRGRGGPRCMSMPFWREDL